jgi:hypothetical protein
MLYGGAAYNDAWPQLGRIIVAAAQLFRAAHPEPSAAMKA